MRRMRPRQHVRSRTVAAALLGLFAAPATALAHGPVFSPGPETIWKGGTEVTVGASFARASGAGMKRQRGEAFVEVNYGLTRDWEVGIELPAAALRVNGLETTGIGDIVVDSKYQFWKRDLPGAQYKASVFGRLKLPSARDTAMPALGNGAVDVTAGLAAGYESRRWYAFASAAYQIAGSGGGGLDPGDNQFVNLVGGVRPVLTAYEKPDTVVMVELNWQRADRDVLNGVGLANTGGWELFVSPVLWWTYRQVAVKGGFQLPLAEQLNGAQAASDYRGKLEISYHF